MSQARTASTTAVGLSSMKTEQVLIHGRSQNKDASSMAQRSAAQRVKASRKKGRKLNAATGIKGIVICSLPGFRPLRCICVADASSVQTKKKNHASFVDFLQANGRSKKVSGTKHP